jgi:protoporphyrin/coproporphyrin ferrochelatase
MSKTALLLLNVGTPDSCKVSDVRRFLLEFLGDARVISIPWLARKILVNLIIAPFRAPKSAKLYQKLWTENGSPLLFHSQLFQQKLQKSLGNDVGVFLAMRYQNPSLAQVLAQIEKANYVRLLIFPLFPQYAESTTGTAFEAIFASLKNWRNIPEIKTIGPFYDNPDFIKNIANRIRKHWNAGYGHLIFSYHGLPLKQTYAAHQHQSCDLFNCKTESNDQNLYCYQAACYLTSRLIAAELNLSESEYSVAFQSRFAKNWLSPFTDDLVIEKAKKGVKKLLVASPAFVADCLETLVEIGEDYRQLFRLHGGEKLQLVESLNSDEDWVETATKIVRNHI